MPSDIVKIVNAALSLIGERDITSLADAVPAAEKASIHWEIVRDDVLRSHDWNCARARAVLIAEADPPAFGFAYSYLLPNNPYCLRVLSVQPNGSAGSLNTITYNRHDNVSPSLVYSIEGRKLLTDADSVNIIYTKRITDPNEFDGNLTQLLVAELAYALSFDLSGSSALQDRMEARSDRLRRKARAMDAREEFPYIDGATSINMRVT